MWHSNFDNHAQTSIKASTSNYGYPGNSGASTSHMSKPQRSASTNSSLTRISNLVAGTNIEKMMGVVIAKEESRHFPSKKDPTTQCYLLSFTFRDSETDFINLTCWGDQEFIEQLSAEFHIGDVVEISNCLCQTKPLDGSDEKFRPSTPSPFQLSVNEKRSSIQLSMNWEATELYQLANIPVKECYDFFSIADINSNGPSISGDNISLLVAVKKVGEARDITTRFGKKLKRCELIVFDDTTASFPVVFWDKEQIHLIQTLAPRDFVLFIADIRVKFDDFKKCMVGTAFSKTIVTVNPDTREAHRLYQFAQNAVINDDEASGGNDGNIHAPVDLTAVHTVMKISDIKTMNIAPDAAFECVITYAFMSNLDLDGEQNVITEKCSVCRQRLDASAGICINHECQQGSRFDLNSEQTSKDAQFDLRVGLSDHSGTLNGCILSGEVASKVFGMLPMEFQALSEDQRVALKWKFLLERCKVYVKVLPPKGQRARPLAVILQCDLADPKQVNRYLV